MVSAGSGAAAARRPRAGTSARSVPLNDASTTMWVCLLPCVLISGAAIVLLGPPLGRIVYPDSRYTFLSFYARAVRPEHTEQMRFILSLGAPVLLSLATCALTRRHIPLPEHLLRPIKHLSQSIVALSIVACMVAQYRFVFGTTYTRVPGQTMMQSYFSPATLIVAALIAAAIVLAARSQPVREAVVAWTRQTRTRRIVAYAIASVMTMAWMLPALNTEASLASARRSVLYHAGFHLDETFAVLNGLTPLVDFTAQYSSLWPFVASIPMLLLGKTYLVFSITMVTLSVLALLALFGVLHRVTRNAVIALALFLPVLATSLFITDGDLVRRVTAGTYYATFPLRYAGPCFLAWLTARHLDRQRSAIWPLFVVAGLVTLNNVDYGFPALGATAAALLWTTLDWRRRSLLRIGAQALAGLGIALALVAALTLISAGSLPQLGRLVEFARRYSVGGFSDMPLPGILGLHLIIYATYVAAIGTATVRAIGREPNRVLTGMLAWVGVFGLGSAGYYVGRSHPAALPATFAAWSLTVSLLGYIAAEKLARSQGRPGIATVVVLMGLGVTTCSLAQLPMPSSQLQRIQETSVDFSHGQLHALPLAPIDEAEVRTFVISFADGDRFVRKAGAPIALLATTGHRIADAYGVRNVVPFTGAESIHTVEQVDQTVAALRKAGGNTMLLPTDGTADPQMYTLLARRGFDVLTTRGLRRPQPKRLERQSLKIVQWYGSYLMKWVDTHHLHPRALGR